MNQLHSHAITIFWAIWFGVSMAAFCVVEFTMLAMGRPQDTLSANVWRMEDFLPGQSFMHWSAMHFLFIGVFLLMTVWLLFHFGWGMFR